MRMNKLPEPSEFDQQCAVFRFAELMSNQYPVLKYLWASMNGIWIQGPNKWALIKKAQAAGCLKSGYPDIGLDVAMCGYHGLRIELKKTDGKVSGAQENWIRFLIEQGYYAVPAWGEDHAKEILMRYVGGKVSNGVLW